MIEFPADPAIGDTVTGDDGTTWVWSGETWDLVSGGGGGGSGIPGPPGPEGPMGPAGPTGPAAVSVPAARMRASIDNPILMGQAIGYISDPVPFGRTRATDPSVIDQSAGVVSIKKPGLYLISVNVTWAGYHATASAPNTGMVSLQAAVVKFADTNSNYWLLRSEASMNPPVEPVAPVNPRLQTISISGTYMVDTASEASPFLLHLRLAMGSRITNERVQISGSVSGPSDGQEARTYIEVVRLGDGGIAGWEAFTPTWNNLTVGDGVSKFVKRYEGKTLQIVGGLQLGSTSVMGTDPLLNLPDSSLTTMDASDFPPAGSAYFIIGGVWYPAMVFAMSASPYIMFRYMGGDPVVGTKPSSALPATWAAGDHIRVNLSIPLR